MAKDKSKIEIDAAFTRDGLKGLSLENAFSGATSFMRRTYTKDLTGVDLAVTGVPFDGAVTNRTGTRMGPRAIREASSLQDFDRLFGWDFHPLKDYNVVDYGDLGYDYAKVSEFPAALQAHISGILDAGAASLVLGGGSLYYFPDPKSLCREIRPAFPTAV